MSNNLESDRSITSGKMYPIDLAPQKITIVKSASNSEVKMAHLVSGQPKTSGTSQIITHTGPLSLMRPSSLHPSPSVSAQPQMIVSGSPMLQVTQIVSQGSQIIGQGPQIISQSQLIGPGGQIVSPATQIISQGTQLSSNQSNMQGNVSSTGTQVINVGGQLVSGSGNLVVSSTVRTLPPSVRVLPPLPHHNTRPGTISGVSLSSNMTNVGTGMVVSKTLTSHVPRGPAAGASLAVPRVAARPITPVSQTLPLSSLGSWSTTGRSVRGAVVYSARAPRAPLPSSAPRLQAPIITVASNASLAPVTSNAPAYSPMPTVVTLSSSTVLSSVSSVITGSVRGPPPRAAAPNPVPQSPRPLPLLQRNYQPAKVVGVGGPVGNSAPAHLYYEVPRAAPPAPAPAPAPCARVAAPFPLLHQNNQVNVVSASARAAGAGPVDAAGAPQPRPSILRKRDIDGSPTKNSTGPIQMFPSTSPPPWEAVAEAAAAATEQDGCGSTTVSASSSPAPDGDSNMPSPPPQDAELSPRKKPRKQMLSNEVRQCDYQTEETPVISPPVRPPPKRPTLSSSYVCGWRATALHFVRPTDVRRRPPRPRDILAIAGQRHVLAAAEGWKVHHLTAQMDDLVSLEADVGAQLGGVLRALEAAPARAQPALRPHAHALLELVKGNIQRSKIVCEGIQEAREDILRVFTHRTFVSDILSRQADKRCFRKHRSQS